MSDLMHILRRTARRHLAQRVVRFTGTGLLAALGAGCALLLLARATGLPLPSIIHVAVAAAGLLCGLAFAFTRQPGPHTLAVLLDHSFDLKDRLGTAEALTDHTPRWGRARNDAGFAELVLPAAVFAPLGLDDPAKAKIEQGRESIVRHEDDAASAAAIAPRGAPEWHEFLPPKRDRTFATVARRDLQRYLVDEVHARHYVGRFAGATDLVLEQISGTRTLRRCRVVPWSPGRRRQTPVSSKLWLPKAWKQYG